MSARFTAACYLIRARACVAKREVGSIKGRNASVNASCKVKGPLKIMGLTGNIIDHIIMWMKFISRDKLSSKIMKHANVTLL